jgi:hypothetical protein
MKKKTISDGSTFYLKRSATLIEPAKKHVEPDTEQNPPKVKPWARWGKRDKYPQELLDEIMKDPTASGIYSYKRSAHYAGGIQFFTKTVKDGKEVRTPVLVEDMHEEIQEFIWNNDIENFIQEHIADFEIWNMSPVEYITNRIRTKIVEIHKKKMINTRIELMDREVGKLTGLYISPFFGLSDLEVSGVPRVRLMERRNPMRFTKSIYLHKLASPDRDYYVQPPFHSIYRWLEISNRIPAWILANIENSLNIKYHITYPKRYFEERYPQGEMGEEEYQAHLAVKKQEFFAKIDDYLAGEKNAQKLFATEMMENPVTGEPMKGWTFENIQNDLKDEAWLRAYNVAQAAICTGGSIDGTLANIKSTANLNSGSGSDTREKFNVYNQQTTIQGRQTTTEWWDIICRANKWHHQDRFMIDTDQGLRRIHFGFKQVTLETTDNSRSGVAINSQPTEEYGTI